MVGGGYGGVESKQLPDRRRNPKRAQVLIVLLKIVMWQYRYHLKTWLRYDRGRRIVVKTADARSRLYITAIAARAVSVE